MTPDKDMTLFCCQCGSLRRLPVTGAPFIGAPIDDMDAVEIERHARRA